MTFPPFIVDLAASWKHFKDSFEPEHFEHSTTCSECGGPKSFKSPRCKVCSCRRVANARRKMEVAILLSCWLLTGCSSPPVSQAVASQKVSSTAMLMPSSVVSFGKIAHHFTYIPVTNLTYTVSGIGSVPSGQIFYLRMSTNLNSDLQYWSLCSNYTYAYTFTFTIPVTSAEPKRFFQFIATPTPYYDGQYNLKGIGDTRQF